jgi:hypothetical protein
MHLYEETHMYIHTYIHTYIHFDMMYTYIYILIYTYIYIYTYIHRLATTRGRQTLCVRVCIYTKRHIRPLIHTSNIHIQIHAQVGDNEGAAEALRQSMHLYEELEDEDKVMECHNQLGMAYTKLGELC